MTDLILNRRLEPLLFAAVTFFSTGLGGLIALRFKDRLHLLLGFSAGAVVAVVFFNILPALFTDVQHNQPIMLAAAVGFLSFFALERYTALHKAREHPHSGTEHAPELGNLGAAGLSLHSFLDGVAIGIGFQSGPTLGLAVALAVILHDLSDGLNTVTVVLAHGSPLRRSIAWLLVDMSTPLLGAASTLVCTWPAKGIPWLLAYFAGFFLYVGASDLLPEARESASPLVGVATVFGMLLVYLVTQTIGK